MAETAMPLSSTTTSTTSSPDQQEAALSPSPHQQASLNNGLIETFKSSSMTSVALTESGPKHTEKHLGDTVKAIAQGMQASCLQWEQVMAESEQFEMFCPTRVDKLLQEAKAMEAHLLQQKEQLINSLKKLSQTLQVST